MTLIVVDQFRVTADSYATETCNRGTETLHSGFPKILRMPGIIDYVPVNVQSFTTVAFCGAATTFIDVWRAIEHRMIEQPITTEADLVEVAAPFRGEPVLLIFPFPSAVLTLMVGQEETPVVSWQEGAVHGFGSGYLAPVDGSDEYRSWYTLFFEALDAGRIPGNDLHFMMHSQEVREERPIEDTLKPECAVKRVRRRMPWSHTRKPSKSRHSK